MTLPFKQFYKSFLRSFGQVMLQGNAITGLLFLLGIGLSSPIMLLGSILATISGLAVAKLCRFDLTTMENGLYGFNAVLVGVAVFYFLPVSFTSLLIVIFGGAFSTALTHFMLVRVTSVPAFTTPFILSTWGLLSFIDYAKLSTVPSTVFSSDLAGYRFSGMNSAALVDYFQASMRGISQVMLQDYWLTGVFFLCAIFIHCRTAAIAAFIGSAVGMLLATGFNFPHEKVMMGLYGFNSCLVAIALVGRYENKPWLIMLAILLTVVLTRAFEWLSIPVLTAPFVITTLLIIALVNIQTNYADKRNALRNVQ
ncbi:urea transporter [Colwellia sp. TT2012]|uniref:urea transporter n=1 Tax=Colwellia sp. TT2012 TaxID=1720342 RepID=UPI0018D25300|nr:urea transporter [Colwellia sp. TT2012]